MEHLNQYGVLESNLQLTCVVSSLHEQLRLLDVLHAEQFLELLVPVKTIQALC